MKNHRGLRHWLASVYKYQQGEAEDRHTISSKCSNGSAIKGRGVWRAHTRRHRHGIAILRRLLVFIYRCLDTGFRFGTWSCLASGLSYYDWKGNRSGLPKNSISIGINLCYPITSCCRGAVCLVRCTAASLCRRRACSVISVIVPAPIP